VMRLASEDQGVAAAVSQVPFSSGLASGLKLPPLTALGVALAGFGDLVKSAMGLPPHYIRLLGSPGDVALMSAPDCADGYARLVPKGLEESGRWTNRVTARTGLAVTFYAPCRRAKRVKIPIFVGVAEQDSIAPAGPTIEAAKVAPRAELKRYPGGHFDYYAGQGFELIIADEIEFLRRHLGLVQRGAS